MLWAQTITHFSVVVRVSSGRSHTYPPHLTEDWNNNPPLSVVSIIHVHTYWQSISVCLHIIWHYLFHMLNRYIRGKDHLWQAGTPSEAGEHLQVKDVSGRQDEAIACSIQVVTRTLLRRAESWNPGPREEKNSSFFLISQRGLISSSL